MAQVVWICCASSPCTEQMLFGQSQQPLTKDAMGNITLESNKAFKEEPKMSAHGIAFDSVWVRSESVPKHPTYTFLS